jgi:hypothetical protein
VAFSVEPVGYRNSGRDSVLVDEAAQHVPPADVRGPEVTRRWQRPPGGRPKTKPAMGPRLVVVLDVGAKDTFQVSSAEDECPVQAFGPEGAHPPFAEGVRVRGPDRGEDDPHEERLWADQERAPRLPRSSLLAAARSALSEVPYTGRLTCRRRMATW